MSYVGNELDLFCHAHNWKAYFRSVLARHIAGDVAEIGAGIGATTEALASLPGVTRWLCVEADAALCRRIEEKRAAGALPDFVEIHAGMLADLPAAPSFDCLIYIDVLEHITDDREELARAFARLRPGGRLAILAPAWQLLFSAFDRAIGHHRRYTVSTLRRIAPTGAREIRAHYLDCVGFFASLANKLLLRRDLPRLAQIRFWDGAMVPLSRLFDPLLRRLLGRSVIIVWEKPAI